MLTPIQGAAPEPPGPLVDADEADRLATIGKALSHPLRIQIMAVLRQPPARVVEARVQPKRQRAIRPDALSPRELAAALEGPLANVAYHVRTLADFGAIAEAGTVQRRGALEHYYRLTPVGDAFLALLDAPTHPGG